MASGQLGMLILLTSLAILFGASLVGYGITRAHASIWIAPGMPALPRTLWLSTGVIFLTSLALESARRNTLKNKRLAATRALTWAWILSLLFVTGQALTWISLGQAVTEHTTLYPFTFYFLTGLHAAHVLAGFVPLSIVTVKQGRAEYSSSAHAGLDYCVQYWHFLALVWFVLFLTLRLGS